MLRANAESNIVLACRMYSTGHRSHITGMTPPPLSKIPVSPDIQLLHFFGAWTPDVRTTSPGPASRPESFFDATEARRGPPEAENGNNPDAPNFLERRISGTIPVSDQ
eukprot:9479646-Pyramimonas_sp.AAC.1